MQGNTQEKLNMCVNYTIQSGVQPIEVLLQPIYDCYGAEAIAYKALVRVNSIVSGVLMPDDYINGTADEELLNQLTFRAIRKVAQAKARLESANVKFRRLYVRCPSSFIYAQDLYANLKLLLAEQGVTDTKICLEFDAPVMETESAKLQQCFSDIRAAGLKVAVNGYGGQGFSIEKLLRACPDHLFADETLAQLAVDREKRTALPPLINFAKSLGSDVIACGIRSDEQLREFRSRDCYGFIPNRHYKGAFTVESEGKTVHEILTCGGENDQ